MIGRRLFLVAWGIAFLTPIFTKERIPLPVPRADLDALSWPASIEGRMISELPLGDFEWRGLREFPGRVGRFTDGERSYTLRRVAAPTRWLHPASDCYRGLGFEIGNPRVVRGVKGSLWRNFSATKEGQRLNVREQIVDADGRSFSDVSSWYWAATFGTATPPYLAITVVDR